MRRSQSRLRDELCDQPASFSRQHHAEQQRQADALQCVADTDPPGPKPAAITSDARYRLFPPPVANRRIIPSFLVRNGSSRGRSRRSMSFDASQQHSMPPAITATTASSSENEHSSHPGMFQDGPDLVLIGPLSGTEPQTSDNNQGHYRSVSASVQSLQHTTASAPDSSLSSTPPLSRVEQVQRLLAKQRAVLEQNTAHPEAISPLRHVEDFTAKQGDNMHSTSQRPIGPGMQDPRRPATPLRRQDSPASVASSRDPVGLGLSLYGSSNATTPDLGTFPVPNYFSGQQNTRSQSPLGYSVPRPHSPHGGPLLRPSSPQRQYGISPGSPRQLAQQLPRPQSPQRQYGNNESPRQLAQQFPRPTPPFTGSRPGSPATSARADSPIYTPPGFSATRKMDHNLRVNTAVSSPQRLPQPSLQQQQQQTQRAPGTKQDPPRQQETQKNTSLQAPQAKRTIRKSTLEKPLPPPPPIQSMLSPAPPAELSDSEDTSPQDSPISTPPPISPISPVSPMDFFYAATSTVDVTAPSHPTVGSPVSAMTTMDDVPPQVPLDAPSVPPIPKSISRKPVPKMAPDSQETITPSQPPPSSKFQIKVKSPGRKGMHTSPRAEQPKLTESDQPSSDHEDLEPLSRQDTQRTITNFKDSKESIASSPPQAESPIELESARTVVIQPLEKPVVDKAASIVVEPDLSTSAEPRAMSRTSSQPLLKPSEIWVPAPEMYTPPEHPSEQARQIDDSRSQTADTVAGAEPAQLAEHLQAIDQLTGPSEAQQDQSSHSTESDSVLPPQKPSDDAHNSSLSFQNPALELPAQEKRTGSPQLSVAPPLGSPKSPLQHVPQRVSSPSNGISPHRSALGPKKRPTMEYELSSSLLRHPIPENEEARTPVRSMTPVNGIELEPRSKHAESSPLSVLGIPVRLSTSPRQEDDSSSGRSSPKADIILGQPRSEKLPSYRSFFMQQDAPETKPLVAEFPTVPSQSLKDHSSDQTQVDNISVVETLLKDVTLESLQSEKSNLHQAQSERETRTQAPSGEPLSNSGEQLHKPELVRPQLPQVTSTPDESKMEPTTLPVASKQPLAAATTVPAEENTRKQAPPLNISAVQDQIRAQSASPRKTSVDLTRHSITPSSPALSIHPAFRNSSLIDQYSPSIQSEQTRSAAASPVQPKQDEQTRSAAASPTQPQLVTRTPSPTKQDVPRQVPPSQPSSCEQVQATPSQTKPGEQVQATPSETTPGEQLQATPSQEKQSEQTQTASPSQYVAYKPGAASNVPLERTSSPTVVKSISYDSTTSRSLSHSSPRTGAASGDFTNIDLKQSSISPGNPSRDKELFLSDPQPARYVQPPVSPRADQLSVPRTAKTPKIRPNSSVPPPVPRKDTVKAGVKGTANARSTRNASASSIQPEPTSKQLKHVPQRGDSLSNIEMNVRQSPSLHHAEHSREKSVDSTSIEAIRARITGISQRTAKAVEPPAKDEKSLLSALEDLSKQSEALHQRYAGMRVERQKLSASITNSLRENKAGPQYTTTLLDQHMALSAVTSTMDICFAKLKSLDCRKEEAISALLFHSQGRSSSASARKTSASELKSTATAAGRQGKTSTDAGKSGLPSTIDAGKPSATDPRSRSDSPQQPQSEIAPQQNGTKSLDDSTAIVSHRIADVTKGVENHSHLVVTIGSMKNSKTPPPKRPLPAPPARRKSPVLSLSSTAEEHDVETPKEEQTKPITLKGAAGRDVRVYTDDDLLEYYHNAS